MTPRLDTDTESAKPNRRLRPIDQEVCNLSQIEEERGKYYRAWKDAEDRIREVRTSLMWRIYRASMAIRRVSNRSAPERVPDSLIEAIEASPPENKKKIEKPPPPQSRSAPRWQPEAENSLEARLERALFERGGYNGEWQHAENRLKDIRSSVLWRRWQPYRRLQARSARILSAVLRIMGAVALAPIHFVSATVRLTMALPGTLYTGLWVAATLLRAKLRARTTSESRLTGSAPVDEAAFRPRVLIVSPYHIHPPNHGSGVRLTNLIRNLAGGCEIFVLVFSLEGEQPEERAALEPFCSRVDFHRWFPKTRPDRWGLRPAIAEVFRSARAAAKIRDIVRANDIDIVQLDHAELSQYRSAVPADVPVVLTEHDISFRSHRRRQQLRFHTRFEEARVLQTSPVEIMRLFRYEIRNCKRIHQIHMMSNQDASYLGRYLPDSQERLVVAPNGVNTEDFQVPEPAPIRNGVLFVGNFNHLPNVDALEFLVNDIWPLVRLRVPGARLTIVGANPSARVRSLTNRTGVELAGEVPDPRPYYHNHKVMVAPIRAGSGTRLKILESFAAGIPVVSTTLGAEGINATDRQHILLADRAMDFALAIERLLANESLHASIATAAAELVREQYDWKFVAQRVRDGYRQLLATRKSLRHSEDSRARTSRRDAPDPVGDETRPDVSIVIPTLNGGSDLERCLQSIRKQQTGLRYEIICVDSGSVPGDLDLMQRHGARVAAIEKQDFNHGLTRDYGASLARGDFLVFLSQDAVPVRDDWLQQIIEPLRRDATGKLVAVQGGSTEVLDPGKRFFWGTGGGRFYFTRESERWIDRYGGIGFSTANCAIRRIIWDRYRFGWAPILEDKKWQREIVDAGYKIASLHDVRVFHSHAYGFRSLVKRCASEGYGWRLLGEHYRLVDALSDVFTLSVWKELGYGLQLREARSIAEIAFPLLRPSALWWGNRFLRRVLH